MDSVMGFEGGNAWVVCWTVDLDEEETGGEGPDLARDSELAWDAPARIGDAPAPPTASAAL